MARSLIILTACVFGVFAQDISAATPLRRGTIETCMWGDSLDFSLITDTCQKRNMSGGSCSFNTCTVLVSDVRISSTKIYAPKGVLFFASTPDTNCLDTLRSAPKSGYLDSAVLGSFAGGRIFVVRTSEMKYAALYLLQTISQMPFLGFKWIYQPDSTADFIKTTSVQTTGREMNATLRNVKTVSNRDNILVSWTPVSGTLRFRLFDLKGRQVCSWECDGRQGALKASLKALTMAHSAYVLQILSRNEAEPAEKNFILSPR